MVPSTDIQCVQREKFLDERLSQEDLLRFELHLHNCDSCRAYIEDWDRIRESYSEWALHQFGYQRVKTNQKDAKLFMGRLNQRMAALPPKSFQSGNTFIFRMLIPVAAAITIAIAAIVYWRITAQTGGTHQKAIVHTPAPSASAPSQKGQTECTVWRISDSANIKETVVLKDGRFLQSGADEHIIASVGHDTIGMDRNSRLAVQHIDANESALTLQQGTAVFEVSPRADGNVFRVFADDTAITVIGTRFAVEIINHDVVVGVGKGTVLVQRQNEQLKLSEGNVIAVSPGNPLSDMLSPLNDEKLQAMAQLLSTDSVSSVAIADSETPQSKNHSRTELNKNNRSKNPRELTQWQNLILDDKSSEATRQIQSYLAFVPNDGDALMLLATCQKNEKKYIDAFQTYQKVIASSNPALANQARYLAGELAQNQLGRNDQAVNLFESYLIHSPRTSPIRGEAKLRLSRALLNMNQIDRAQKLLQEIVDEYRRTPVANRARKMLDQIP